MKCPIDKKDCIKEECQMWLELTVNGEQQDKHQQGKCAIAWLPVLLIELRTAIEGKRKNERPDS